MVQNLALKVIVVFLACQSAAFAGPKEDIQAALDKLDEAPNYSWNQTNAFGTDSNQTIQGKTQKYGLTWLSTTVRDNQVEVLRQGTMVLIKSDNAWRDVAEIEAAPGPAQFVARSVARYRAPARELKESAAHFKEVQSNGDLCTAELTEEGAARLASFGVAPLASNLQVKNTKAVIKFWLKDGTLSKAEVATSYTINFRTGDREVSRTTTVEFKDVGATKIEVPAEAKAKIPL